MTFKGFPKSTLKFLAELKDNNDRDWFAENKQRYLDEVVEPGLAFISAMETPLKKVSPHFLAIAKRSGGSMLRIYRDIRFSKNKSPYKPNLGIQFRHEMGKDIHAPGFYFHAEPGNVFLGAGIWSPDSKALKQIRATIDEFSPRWKRIKSKKTFAEQFEFWGDTLKRPPRDYSADHPLIEDLKRKDHIVLTKFKDRDICSPEFVKEISARMRLAMPYVRFLCDALHLPA